MGRVKKDFSFDYVTKKANEFHSAGKIIGITHGTFDLFHYGHLLLLQEASEQCDILVVGVESDSNVRKYKPKGRPVVSEEHRAEILSAINCVDLVFINNGEWNSQAYSDIYKELNAKIVAIGVNYSYPDVMQEQAKKGGASLFISKRASGESSSSILKKAKENKI